MSKLYKGGGFGTCPNALLNDDSLSFKAKGLYTYMQSKPDGWDFSIRRITQQTDEGETAIRSGIEELEQTGYLDRKQKQKEDGKWGGYDYYIYTKPIVGKPHDGSSHVGEAHDNSKKDNSKKEKERKNKYNNIFEYWNSKNIIKHRKLRSRAKTQIKARLKEYSVSEIKESIDNYAKVLHSDKTFFDYKWTLMEFLKRKNGLPVFLYKGIEDYKESDGQEEGVLHDGTKVVKQGGEWVPKGDPYTNLDKSYYPEIAKGEVKKSIDEYDMSKIHEEKEVCEKCDGRGWIKGENGMKKCKCVL